MAETRALTPWPSQYRTRQADLLAEWDERGCDQSYSRRLTCRECGRDFIDTNNRPRRRCTPCQGHCNRARFHAPPRFVKCAQCGAIVRTKRAGSKFCDAACRQKAHRARNA